MFGSKCLLSHERIAEYVVVSGALDVEVMFLQHFRTKHQIINDSFQLTN